MNQDTISATSIRQKSLNGHLITWGLMTGLLVTAALFLLIRFTTPSDGVYIDVSGGPSIDYDGLYVTALEDNVSDLQTGDAITAIDGRSVDTWANHLIDPAYERPNWQVDDQIIYTVVRDDETLNIAVRLVSYPIWAGIKPISVLIGLSLLTYGFMLYMYVRRPDEHATRALAVMSAALLNALFWVMGLIPADFVQAYPFWLHICLNWGLAVALIALTYFLLVFPLPHPMLQRSPGKVWALLLAPRILEIFALLFYALWGATSGIDWIIMHYFIDDLVGTLGFIMIVAAGIMSYRQSRSNLVASKQWRWLSVAFVYNSLLTILTWYVAPYLTGQPAFSPNVFAILTLPALIMLMMAVLRYRLWDIDILINRSLVYGIVTALIAGIFFAVLVGIQMIVGQTSGWIVLGIVAVVSVPLLPRLRRGVQDFVDRRVYGFRFNQDQLAAGRPRAEIPNPGRLTGENIEGHDILGVIGQGGMGEVYKGAGKGNTIAVKTLLPKYALAPISRAQFENEAHIGLQLDHPHLIRVLSLGTIHDLRYILMEYIDGPDLNQYIKKVGCLAVPDALQVAQHMCAALTIMHQQGFVHRDLKPANIMIRPNGAAVLMDFSISKSPQTPGNLTGSGAVGTIAYMSPEQIMVNQDIDHRADLYALGVVLYEMVTGKKPFTGSAPQVMFAHLEQPPPDPRESIPALPAALTSLIWRAMEKDPAKRFQSAEEFAAALRGL